MSMRGESRDLQRGNACRAQNRGQCCWAAVGTGPGCGAGDTFTSYVVLNYIFPGDTMVKKNPPANAGDGDSIPGLEKIPWRRKWQPTPVFLPEKFHGQRSLAGYSPWGPEESDTTEPLSMHVWSLVMHEAAHMWISGSQLGAILVPQWGNGQNLEI